MYTMITFCKTEFANKKQDGYKRVEKCCYGIDQLFQQQNKTK